MRTSLRTLLATCALATTAVALPLATTGPAVAATTAPTAPATPATPTAATRSVVVRPVTATGQAAPGWTVHHERGSLDCDGTSPSAVDPGIASCYPTAASARACWKSARHTVLCVSDAREKSLARWTYAGRFPTVTPPAEPTPIDLQLSDGRRCLIRNGGAWGAPSQHPNWLGFDSCTRDASVYAPPSSTDGIDRTQKLWTVRLWRTTPDDIVRRDVRVASYVGTASA